MVPKNDSLNYLKYICANNLVKLLLLIEPFTLVTRLDVTRVRLGFDRAKALLDGRTWIFWFDFLQCSFVEMAN